MCYQEQDHDKALLRPVCVGFQLKDESEKARGAAACFPNHLLQLSMIIIITTVTMICCIVCSAYPPCPSIVMLMMMIIIIIVFMVYLPIIIITGSYLFSHSLHNPNILSVPQDEMKLLSDICSWKVDQRWSNQKLIATLHPCPWWIDLEELSNHHQCHWHLKCDYFQNYKQVRAFHAGKSKVSSI